MSEKDHVEKNIRKSYRFFIVISSLILIIAVIALYFGGPTEEIEIPVSDTNKEVVKTDVDATTGFIEDEGMQIVINNCTTCHSAELVTQNKMTREGWLATIRWMQESQNLWDLGQNEAPILDYLAKHYAPEEKGRRAPLENIEWYALKD